MTKSTSYKKSTCCHDFKEGGYDCTYLDSKNDEPCWGQVQVFDEMVFTDVWLHLCKGHYEIPFESGVYKIEPK